MRVVVIGAGIVGAAVAAGLTRRGARVTVLEERFPGAGSTGTAFGWVHADDTGSEPYFTLSHAAVHAHHALRGDVFVRTGHLAWANGEHRAELARRVERLGAREYAVDRVTAHRAAEMEPALNQRHDTDYAFFPEEGHVFPSQLLGRLLGEAREGGARIELGAAAREVELGSARVTLAGGAVRDADVVVVCAGRWAGALLGTATSASAYSQLVTTTPLPARMSRVLSTNDLDVRPDGGGRLLLRARDVPVDPDLPPKESVTAALLDRLPGALSHTEGVRADRVRVGWCESDRITAGFLDGGRVYSVTGDGGVILAPLLADLVASEIYGKESALLREFRPLSAVPISAAHDAVRPAP